MPLSIFLCFSFTVISEKETELKADAANTVISEEEIDSQAIPDESKTDGADAVISEEEIDSQAIPDESKTDGADAVISEDVIDSQVDESDAPKLNWDSIFPIEGTK
jgi:hypothetical protein